MSPAFHSREKGPDLISAHADRGRAPTPWVTARGYQRVGMAL